MLIFTDLTKNLQMLTAESNVENSG